jgi:hypothetical protein
MSRRDMLGLVKFFGIGAAIIGGGGYYFVSSVMAGIAEEDLTKLANRIPTVVQVHDPGCPSCRALQRSTREALENFEAGEIQYLVANLNSPDGKAFADRHHAGRVTLLLFDAEGGMRQMITGRQSSEVLATALRRLVRRSGT